MSLALLLLAACATPPPPAPIGAPSPTPAPHDTRPRLTEGPRLAGLCDASAGIAVDGVLYVADDERNQLHRFDLEGIAHEPLDLAPIFPAMAGPDEADLEGATAFGGAAWFVGSHDRGKGKKPKESRQRLFALAIDREGPRRYGPLRTDLLDRLAGEPTLAAVLAATEGHTSKDPSGFSLEGLATAPSGLWLGLRAPLVDGHALLIELSDPSGTATAHPPLRLDLDGRGIRALENDGDGLLVVAGPPGDAGTFAMFRRGAEGDLTALDVDLGTLRPEGLVAVGERYLLLSDDGGLDRGGTRCKDLPAEARQARTAWLSLPGAAAP